jgi:hypothetical protein
MDQFDAVLKGHEFTRAVKAAKQTWASAPEGRLMEMAHYHASLLQWPAAWHLLP